LPQVCFVGFYLVVCVCIYLYQCNTNLRAYLDLVHKIREDAQIRDEAAKQSDSAIQYPSMRACLPKKWFSDRK